MTWLLWGLSVMAERLSTEYFVAWCGNNHFIINMNRTKEMTVGFRKTSNKSNTVSI